MVLIYTQLVLFVLLRLS